MLSDMDTLPIGCKKLHFLGVMSRAAASSMAEWGVVQKLVPACPGYGNATRNGQHSSAMMFGGCELTQ